MPPETILIIAAGAVFGGFINGLAGFGTSLFALGWWLQIMSPAEAVPVALVMSVASGLQGVALVRHSIDWPRLLRFLLPALAGVPLGLVLLDRIEAQPLKILIAAFMVAYGGFLAFRKDLPNITRQTPVIDASIGFLSGVLGAVAGLSGALPTMWSSLRNWGKSERRALLQPFNVVILGLSALALAVTGGIGQTSVMAMLIALPATMLSAQVGIGVFKRLSDTQFRRLVIVLMLVSGVILLLREML